MKRAQFLIPALLFAAGCAEKGVTHTALTAAVRREEVTSRRMAMENEFLRLTLLPELSGGVQNVVWKKEDLPLLCGGTFIRVSNGPLLVRPASSGVIFYEKFWGSPNVGLTDMTVTEQSAHQVELFARNFDAQPASLSRRITLEPGNLLVNFDVVLTPHPGENLSPGTIRPWLNLLASQDISWRAVIPALGGDRINGLGQRTDFPATGIYRSGRFGPNTFFTPARRWIAVSSAEKKISLALIHDVERTCTMYSWQGIMEGRPARTIEFIFPDPAKKGNEVRRYRYRLAVFPGIGDLREIVQDTALETRRENGKLILRFCAARPVTARSIRVGIRRGGEETVLKGADSTPALPPGKIVEAAFELPDGPAGGEIAVTWGEESFTLLNEIER